MTTERSARPAPQYQAALLGSLFEASIDGILAVDVDGTVLAHNQRFLELWGLDAALIDGGDEALLEAAMEKVPDGPAFVAGVLAAYDHRPAHVQDELTLLNGIVLDRHGTRLDDADGTFLGFAWSFRDVSAERAHQAEIEAAGERFAALARTLQQSLLPPRLPSPTGIQLAARYHPAFTGIDVGGDFYDVFAVGAEWVLVVGDVCGKGAEAAAITALVRHTIRAAAMHDPDPATTLAELNLAMLASPEPNDDVIRFATVCCIRLRPSPEGVMADIACGGHPPPLILRADGGREVGAPNGSLIGVLDLVDVTTRTTLLRPGDGIVVVTDGVLEARDDAGRFFGEVGLSSAIDVGGGGDALALSEEIERQALAFQGGLAKDDIAILVARIEELP
jgi:sigma-B regulation protein RsbU (phosphoserine phosphatase)